MSGGSGAAISPEKISAMLPKGGGNNAPWMVGAMPGLPQLRPRFNIGNAARDVGKGLERARPGLEMLTGGPLPGGLPEMTTGQPEAQAREPGAADEQFLAAAKMLEEGGQAAATAAAPTPIPSPGAGPIPTKGVPVRSTSLPLPASRRVQPVSIWDRMGGGY